MNMNYFKWLIKDVLKRPFRNNKNLMGDKVIKNTVNIEWWSGTTNIGDCLAPIIVDWLLDKKHIKINKKTNNTHHLMTVGSLIGAANFDSVVWGTGIMNAKNAVGLVRNSQYMKLDIRAVRGPITREILTRLGYDCPCVFGDPGVLMPLIYNPKIKKQHRIGMICHHLSNVESKDIYKIDVATDDYKSFIDELLSCEMIVSSSLHGIILAESYKVPTIFLNNGVWEQTAKYMDWYYSTNRYNIKMISSLEELSKVTPMELPNLENMRESLINSFPYDLWS